MNFAKKLLQFDFDADAFARRALEPIGIFQKSFEILEEIIKNYGDRGTELPNREDLREIYHNFINAHRTGMLHTEFDSLRRIRQLSWMLTYSEGESPRIVDTPQLGDALGLIENRFCISTLLGVFDALLQAWDTPNAERLRAFVKKHLTDYNESRKFVQKLKANMAWYCEENGTTQLAMMLLRSRVKLSELWSYLELPDHTHSYPYFGAVAEAHIALNRRTDRETVTDVIEFVEKHNNGKTSRTVLSKLIERLGYDSSEHLRQPIQSYILREWEDPRIAGGVVRWRGVSDEAKQIFTRWITKEDIRFFFDVVAKACNDHKFEYRKAFWLAYLEHISFCRLVLRQNAEYLFRNDPYYQKQKQSIATLNGGSSDQHAFIIQIGNYIFVEFSTSAACYVYENSRLPFRLDNSAYTMNTWNRNTLRDQSLAKYRVIHRNSEDYSWQRDFVSWLRMNVGIEPVRRYQLENIDKNKTDDVAELIQGLSDKRTWIDSSQALVRIGKPAVPALIDALRDGNHSVRFRAINTLGELGRIAEAATPMLRQLRQLDPKDYIRNRADSVLNRINGSYQDKPSRSYRSGNSDNNETDDVAELIQGLGNQQTWLESSQALVRIGKPAVPALIDLLRDEDHTTRLRAVNTLAQLGSSAEAAAPMLRHLRLLDPKDYIRDRADWVLKRINPLAR